VVSGRVLMLRLLHVYHSPLASQSKLRDVEDCILVVPFQKIILKWILVKTGCGNVICTELDSVSVTDLCINVFLKR
jgi:hypothetical protein